MSDATRGHSGLASLYYLRGGGGHARTIRELFADGGVRRAWDPAGVRAQLGESGEIGTLTCFASVARVPPGFAISRGASVFKLSALPLPAPPDAPLLQVLEGALSRALAASPAFAVALSGGVDSALVLALVKRLTGAAPKAFVLAPSMASYDESADALRTAEAIGADVTVVPADEHAFVSALADAVAAAEVPFFNLHPVSKLLLARALAKAGVPVALTGDGADQLFRRDPGEIYLPIAGALHAAAGVEDASIFLDDLVIAWVRARAADPGKRALREAARGLVPQEVLAREKHPRLAPDMDLHALWDRERAAAIAKELGEPAPDRPSVKWVTLPLLHRALVAGR